MSSADPFLQMIRKPDAPAGHAQRAHSKFSASGAERWFNCSGSVELSEGLPDRSSPWAKEGTEAHEVLEQLMLYRLGRGTPFARKSGEMMRHAEHAARFILDLHAGTPDSEVLVETRIYLDFIHPEMFGTFDGAVVDHFGTLHVFDYKYGQGHAVAPGPSRPGGVGNLQMIFYGIGLAHQFQWNFKRVRLWIIQPRVRNYRGPLFWEISISELRAYVDRFRQAVFRVERQPETYTEGPWCHWCRAKSICPLKGEIKTQRAVSVFSRAHIEKVMADLDRED